MLTGLYLKSLTSFIVEHILWVFFNACFDTYALFYNTVQYNYASVKMTFLHFCHMKHYFLKGVKLCNSCLVMCNIKI